VPDKVNPPPPGGGVVTEFSSSPQEVNNMERIKDKKITENMPFCINPPSKVYTNLTKSIHNKVL
jgi:hypothetical protein